MSTEEKLLLAAVLRLPAAARATLAGDIIDSLDDDEPAEDVEAAWADEIQKRLAEVDAGKVKSIPWSEARRRILAAAGVSDH